MDYKVIVCPDSQCRGVSIVGDMGKTVTCRKCDSQYKSRDYKVSYETHSREDAVEARTKLLIRINEDDRSYEELESDGLLDSPDGGVFGKNSERDTRTPQTIIKQSVREVEVSTESDIVEYAVNEGLDEEKAEKVLERLVRKGRAIRMGDEIELL